jgi:cation-transporting ATPase E
VAFSYALLLPTLFGREFWQLDPGHGPTMLLALIVAVVGAVLVQLAARTNRRLEARRVGSAA